MLESFEDAVRRETIEETGILIDDISFLHVANIDYYNPKHYINIGFVAKWKGGEPRVMEPDKIVDWGWYTLEDLPQPLFLQTRLMINSYQKNINFYDQKRSPKLLIKKDVFGLMGMIYSCENTMTKFGECRRKMIKTYLKLCI